MGNKVQYCNICCDYTVLSPFTTSSPAVDLDMALWGLGQSNLGNFIKMAD